MSNHLENIVRLCKEQNSQAQKQLYERYKDTLYAVCRRYILDSQEAEDVFINAFFKILTKIDSFTATGHFESWMRRIVVNEALMHLRKNATLKIQIVALDEDIPEEEWYEEEEDMTYEQVLAFLESLPAGYRTVFNLYVFEDYNQREIAEMLNISINTSKSQYLMAKKRIIELFNQDKTRQKNR